MEEIKEEIEVMLDSITDKAVMKRIYYIIRNYLKIINKTKNDVI